MPAVTLRTPKPRRTDRRLRLRAGRSLTTFMRRTVAALLAASVVLAGCDEASKDGGKGRPASRPAHAVSSTNRNLMNPAPRLSRQAQALKHPPGVDTVAFWGDGRFSVSLDSFYDAEASPTSSFMATFKGIRAMRQESAVVYFVGVDGFLVLDLAAKTHRRFPTANDIPGDLAEGFTRLKNVDDTNNIVFDPKTRTPVQRR